MNEQTKNQSVDNVETAVDGSSDEQTQRRDAIRRIGKYSAYAAPAVLVLNSKTSGAIGLSFPG